MYGSLVCPGKVRVSGRIHTSTVSPFLLVGWLNAGLSGTSTYAIPFRVIPCWTSWAIVPLYVPWRPFPDLS